MYNEVFIRGERLSANIPLTENHIHTTYTDGKNTVDEYVNLAVQKGFKSLVFTEHVNRDSTWFDDYMKDIAQAKERYGKQIKIFAGIEAKAIDYKGNIDATEDMIKACDIVMGVVHRYPDPRGGMLEFTGLDRTLALTLEYEAAKGLLENGNIHVLGHMGGTFEYKFGQFPDELFRELIRLARNNGRVIELNGFYHKRLGILAEYCRQINPWVSLGSDAHEVGKLGLIGRRLKEEGICG